MMRQSSGPVWLLHALLGETHDEAYQLQHINGTKEEDSWDDESQSKLERRLFYAHHYFLISRHSEITPMTELPNFLRRTQVSWNITLSLRLSEC